MITLDELQESAASMGMSAWVEELGGNVVGLHVQRWVAPTLFLITLDGGRAAGTSWCVGLADGSDDSGELPVLSDADQTMRDALAWMHGDR